ncbi:hypothetical protein AB6A40_001802 [Gnathostoma spinigerum]|uniref:SEC7 domain-containing protein n=1 Tax=Gnathostoma spinigerum TaxID=75299 RepID=A0ABD6E566_9BILA
MNDGLKETSVMFLRNAFTRILSDKDIKKKEHLRLKKACEQALEELNVIDITVHDSDERNNFLPTRSQFIHADCYFLPFDLACHSKSPRIIVIALDCLQKLIAYGHLIGNGVDVINPERLLIDRIVESICAPFTGPNTDEGVQLQILKAVLAVVLAPKCEVHEATLLLAVRTCFNIFLASRSPINQSTAKASLTQVISAVFGNMQRAMEVPESTDIIIIREVVGSIINQVVSDCEIQATGSNLNSHHDESMSDAYSQLPRQLSPSSLPGDSSDSLHEDVISSEITFSSVQEKDAFLLFRALCRLSMKPVPDRADSNSHELRSKELSLEMLLLIVQNSSAIIHSSQPFIFTLRQYLCVSLSRNGVSPIVPVFEKSLAIFVQLVNKFKMHLKVQIEVFFREIIFSILESPSSSFEHKWIVVNTVEKICEDPQSVVDIYVNYDCDLSAANLFERMVNGLSKIAQGGSFIDFGNSATVLQRQRERSIRILGLKCLVEILQCMVDWFDDIYCGRSDSLSQNDNESMEGVAIESLGVHPHSPTVYQYEQLKQKKETIEHGIHLFSRKPKQGLKFLQDKQLVGTSPADIAEFFLKDERLDKTVVGDYLGSGEDFNKQVMYAYVDMLNFAGKDFVSALRLFLDGFRLPGEAQKIDRLMEKFASRYCECNPHLGLFASADTAYVLAYSIIMLTTDLHSPQVRNKMTKEQYIEMNRGINDQSDLPREYLSEIYDEISGNEIKMKAGANKLRKYNASSTSERQKKLLQNVELAAMASTAKALMEAAFHYEAAFTSASHYEHVRPMFRIAWTPCLAAFSIGLQTSEDIDICGLCLQGFRLGIRIACLFRLATERDAYIQALARFTLLTAKNSLTEMRSKNIDSIKLLMTVGDEDGNRLDESWFEVLKCISQLELVQLIGTGLHAMNSPDDSSTQYVLKSTSHVDEYMLHSLQEKLGETTSQSVVVAVDRIFQGSSKLDGDAIVHFVKALCAVSLEELSSFGSPRMFMLQKIVEISFYNMNRIRLQWSRIWSILGEHFNKAGCNANEVVAHFAIDALRQLSVKFLERGELPNYRFQKDFLRPFETIMTKNRSLKCRELVVECMSHMVNSHGEKIVSGWKNIFSVFTMAAGSTDEELVESAFATMSYIISSVFVSQFGNALDSFQDAIKCLSEFACNAHFPDICMEAIRLIRLCASYVASNQQHIIDHQWEDGSKVSDAQRVFLHGWFPIMFELSCIIGRCKLDVRTRSLTVMFEIMKTYGAEFMEEWWRDLFLVVFRIFDVMKLAEGQNEKLEWMQTTCNHALYSVVDVFTQYYPILSRVLLSNIYDQLYWCAQQDNEQLARSAVNCLETLVLYNGMRFQSSMWTETITLIVNIFNSTLPHSLLTWEPDVLVSSVPQPKGNDVSGDGVQNPYHKTNNNDVVFSTLLVRCVVQLEMVDAVCSIVCGKSTRKEDRQALSSLVITSPHPLTGAGSVDKSLSDGMLDSVDKAINESTNQPDGNGLYSHIGIHDLLKLVECLMESHGLARKFNSNNAQRTLLWKAGFKGRSKPNLLRQETHSIRAALSILYRLYTDCNKTSDQQKIIVKKKLLSFVSDAITYYLNLTSEQHRNAWISVITLILENSNALLDSQV